MYAMGLMIGPLITGIIASSFGRTRTLIYAEICIQALYVVMTIDNIFIQYQTRFFSGLFAGVSLVAAPVCMIEVLPSNLSAQFTVTYNMFGHLGMMIMSVLGYIGHKKDSFEMDFVTDNWRFVFIWPSIFSVIRLYLYIYVYPFETPQFYMESMSLEKQTNSPCVIYFIFIYKKGC